MRRGCHQVYVEITLPVVSHVLQGWAEQCVLFLQAEEEELRRIRATEETAPPVVADMESATCFDGDITLTARGQLFTLSPDQVRPQHAPVSFLLQSCMNNPLLTLLKPHKSFPCDMSGASATRCASSRNAPLHCRYIVNLEYSPPSSNP